MVSVGVLIACWKLKPKTIRSRGKMRPGQIYLCEVCLTECEHQGTKQFHSMCPFRAFKVDKEKENRLVGE